jgi:hypothetical protein
MSFAAEVEIYRAIIGVLIVVCVFLVWRLEKQKRSVRESRVVPTSFAQERALRSFAGESAPVETQRPSRAEEPPAEPDQEYTFEDPDFSLSPLEPPAGVMGRVEGEHGDAIYGGDARYFKEDYIGRVSRGAELELKDCRVYRNEFELNIIKVRVVSNQWEDEIGKTGWVGLDDTSFRSAFDPEKRIIRV